VLAIRPDRPEAASAALRCEAASLDPSLRIDTWRETTDI
jgi:hypothetical protein